MQRAVLAKTLRVVVVAIAATLIISIPVRMSLGEPIGWANWLVWLLLPCLIAGPISYRLFQQSSELEEANRKLKFAANHDHLTGLWNRAHFLSRLAELERNTSVYAILIFDADHFKRINDNWGHAEGDQALVMIAGALKASSRAEDIVARIGGEEFGAILIGVDGSQAARIAERMRLAVENVPWLTINSKKVRLTVSVGGAVADAGRTAREVLRIADDQLYEAKRYGRNQVMFESRSKSGLAHKPRPLASA